MKGIINFSEEHDEEHWISVSDLMAGLMMVFLFVAVFFIQDVSGEKEKVVEKTRSGHSIEKLAIEWKEIEDSLYKKLLDEFKDDLEKWDAELLRDDLTIRFNEPDVFFRVGESDLQPKFKNILDNFFPRYLKILYEFKGDISEVRIEGHTSSEWKDSSSEDEAYFENMALSQERTRKVLHYSLSLSDIVNYKTWARKSLTANGLSSSQLEYKDEAGFIEDKNKSRRVEFKVKTKSKEKIVEIIKRVE